MSTNEDRAGAIERIAAAPTLLVALDFDGTLSPRQDDPMAARMLPAARTAVDALTRLPGVVVALVSGRSMVDLQAISEHTAASPIHLAGSHGAEFWHPGDGDAVEPLSDAERADRDRLRSEAEQRTADLDGVWIEPKTLGFGVHTRLADAEDTEAAYARIEALMAQQHPDWRRRTGHDLIEFALRSEGKDTAVAVLREAVRADAVLFAGDDVTDEDALASLGAGDLGVRVGEGPTAAHVRVDDIDDMAQLLAELARARAARGRE